jgi:hypothetical protein
MVDDVGGDESVLGVPESSGKRMCAAAVSRAVAKFREML